MLDWLDGLGGPHYTRAILWTLAALVLLLVVLLIIKLSRSLTSGAYVAGGRSRKTRLSVMDATAVDSHRRLVLVRRDDVEHLLLIGGPTDVVVERDIRRVAPARRPALVAGEQTPNPQAKPPPPSDARPVHGPVRPVAANTATASAQHPPAPAQHPPAPKPAPRYTPANTAAPASAAPQSTADPIDAALLNELEVSLEADSSSTAKSASRSQSLDDEMAKLLGELSVHKR